MDVEFVWFYNYNYQADTLLHFRVKTLKCFIYLKHSMKFSFLNIQIVAVLAYLLLVLFLKKNQRHTHIQ